MKKKALAMLLAIVMAVGLLPAAAFAADAPTSGTCGDNLTWSYSGGVLTISGTGPMVDYDPFTYVPWVDWIEDVQTVIIGDGVTSIGMFAFSSCTNLTSVTIPSSVTRIGDMAFNTYQGQFGDPELTDVYYGGGEEQWGQIEKSGFVQLRFATIHYNSTGEKPTEPTEPTEPTGPAAGDFVIEDGVLTKYNGSGSEVTIPDDVTGIGPWAFDGCSSLTSVTIPAGVTSIGVGAFANCENLTSITVKAADAEIGGSAFGFKVWFVYNDEGEVAGGGDAPINGVTIYGYNGSTAQAYAERYGFITFVSLGDAPTKPTEPTEPAEPETPTSGSCGDDLTWSYSDGVLTIEGTGTMYDFIFDPDDPDTYDAPWRDYCWDINAIVIGDGVTSIGEFAFWVCGSLTGVTIPAGVTSVGVGAFNTCLSLTDISVASGNPAYTSVDGILFNAEQTLLHTYPAGKSNSSYSIPASVTTIGKYAFYEQVSLTSVTIPASVTTIDESAFSSCLNLTDVNYGGSAEQWGEISIGVDNDALLNAEIHFAGTDPEPTEPNEPEEPTDPADPEPEITFGDVPENAWYAGAVTWAVEKNLVAGYTDGTFRPNSILTMGAAAVLLGKLDGAGVTDTNPWYQGAMDWAIASGCIDEGDDPNGNITRELLFTLLWRYEGRPAAADTSVLDDFSDSGDIDSWAVEAMAWAVENGIVSGDSHGLNPLGEANRAMAITLFKNYCEKLGK